MKKNRIINKASLTIFLIINSLASGYGADNGEVMFRGNLERTGAFTDGGPSEFNEVGFKFKAKAPIFSSSPAISDGILYIGCIGTYLYAVDIKTGQEKWKYKIGDILQSSPAVSDGVVYVGCKDSTVYGLK